MIGSGVAVATGVEAGTIASGVCTATGEAGLVVAPVQLTTEVNMIRLIQRVIDTSPLLIGIHFSILQNSQLDRRSAPKRSTPN
jgi:hypothetical protein